MSVITSLENFRVRVEPRGLGDFGWASVGDLTVSKDEADRQRQYKQRCEEIAADIKRHVDNVGCVLVECDVNRICEHCGSIWTEDDADYNGGCCAKDEAAHDAMLAAREAQP